MTLYQTCLNGSTLLNKMAVRVKNIKTFKQHLLLDFLRARRAPYLPCLMDRVLVLHTRSRGFDSDREHMSERFFHSNRPGYPHPVSFELENSGIRVAVGDCSVTERRRWRPPYQTGKTVHVHAKHYTAHGAGCVRQWFRTAELLRERRYENWNTHTHSS